MVGTMKAKPLAEFYEKVFGKPADISEGSWYGWHAGSSLFAINEHSEVKDNSKEPARIILNFETSDVKEEFERIKSIGAKVIAEPYQMGNNWTATFADPDGNYFQLMNPWE